MTNDLVFQDGLLGIRTLLIVGITLVLFLITYEPVGERSLGLARRVFHDGPVGLVHLSLSKHLVEAGECLRGTGEDDETTDRTIQTMHHTQEHGSRLGVSLLDIVLYNIREGAIASLIALHDLPTLFVNDDNMVVLVDDLHKWSIIN